MSNPKTKAKIPRKPEASRRIVDYSCRLTRAEHDALKANAAAAGLCRVDYIVRQCCGGTR